METVLYYSPACPHCVTFIRLLDSLPEISRNVQRVRVGRRNPRNLRMVPAIVVGNSEPLYGKKAFEWLKRESSRTDQPFALADQASPAAGIQYTFLGNEEESDAAQMPPASGLDALIAQRNAEIAQPVARA